MSESDKWEVIEENLLLQSRIKDMEKRIQAVIETLEPLKNHDTIGPIVKMVIHTLEKTND